MPNCNDDNGPTTTTTPTLEVVSERVETDSVSACTTTSTSSGDGESYNNGDNSYHHGETNYCDSDSSNSNSRVCQLVKDFGPTDEDEFVVTGTRDKITFVSTGDGNSTVTSAATDTNNNNNEPEAFALPQPQPQPPALIENDDDDDDISTCKSNSNHPIEKPPHVEPDGWLIPATYADPSTFSPAAAVVPATLTATGTTDTAANVTSTSTSTATTAPSTRGEPASSSSSSSSSLSSSTSSSVRSAAAVASLAAVAVVGCRFCGVKATKKTKSHCNRRRFVVVAVEEVNSDDEEEEEDDDDDKVVVKEGETSTAAKVTTTTENQTSIVASGTVSADKDEKLGQNVHFDIHGEDEDMCPPLSNENEVVPVVAESETAESMSAASMPEVIPPPLPSLPTTQGLELSSNALPTAKDTTTTTATANSTSITIMLPSSTATTVRHCNNGNNNRAMVPMDSPEAAVAYMDKLAKLMDVIQAAMAANGRHLDENECMRIAQSRMRAQEQYERDLEEEARKYTFEQYREMQRFRFEGHQRHMDREQTEKIHEKNDAREERHHADMIKLQQQEKDWVDKLTKSRDKAQEEICQALRRSTTVVVAAEFGGRALVNIYALYDGGIAGLYSLAIDKTFGQCNEITLHSNSSTAESSWWSYSAISGAVEQYISSYMPSISNSLCYISQGCLAVVVTIIFLVGTVVVSKVAPTIVRDLMFLGIVALLVMTCVSMETDSLVQVAAIMSLIVGVSLGNWCLIRSRFNQFKNEYKEKGENPPSVEVNSLSSTFSDFASIAFDGSCICAAFFVTVLACEHFSHSHEDEGQMF